MERVVLVLPLPSLFLTACGSTPTAATLTVQPAGTSAPPVTPTPTPAPTPTLLDTWEASDQLRALCQDAVEVEG